MRMIGFLLCAILLGMTTLPAAAESEGTPETPHTDVAILSTTDMHGKCWETNVLTGAAEHNNMLRVFTAVKRFRETLGADNVLLIDNGDLYQGTPVSQVQLYDRISGASQEPLAMSVCLKEIGYNAFVPGNHEFNFPWELMSAEYRWLEENGIPVLSANICSDGTQEGTEPGDPVLRPYLIKTITVNGHEHRIGILGLENCDVPQWDLPANYPGLRFSHPGNDACSMTAEADLFIPQMKEEGCEFIIVSYHGGIGDARGELVFGLNTEDQGMRLIAESTEIDMLIVGHDHSSVYSNHTYPNREGRRIPVVNGGSRELTLSVFRFTENDEGGLEWELVEGGNLDPGGYNPDAELEEKIRPYSEQAEIFVNEPVGLAAGSWDMNGNHFLEQTDTTSLVLASQIEVLTRKIRQAAEDGRLEALPDKAGTDRPEVDCAMTNPTAYEGYLVSPGGISFRDIYRLYRFGNYFIVIPMTGSQLRAVMEENAEKHMNARVHGGKAYIYAAGDTYTRLVFGGINFTCDMSRPAGERIVISGFSNGRPFEEDGVYLAAVNNYILGNGNCGLRDFGTEDAVWPRNGEGEGEIAQDIIAEYIRLRAVENEAVTPEDFTWHWEIVYSADPAAFPVYEGEAAAWLAEEPEDGQSYVILNEAEETALAVPASGSRPEAVKCPASGDALPAPLPEGALVLTASRNKNGSWRFRDAEGRWLTGGAAGELTLEANPGDGGLDCWELEKAGGGWYIINAWAEENPALRFSFGRIDTGAGGFSADGSFTFNFYRIAGE